MAVDPPPFSRAFEEGVDARACGKSLTDNPYAPDAPERPEWAAGFEATFDLDEEDDPLSNRLRKEDDVPDGGPFAPRRGI